MAAASFKDIIQKQQEYLEAEERKKVTETISSAELKKLMAEAVKMGGDVNENVIKLYDEMRKQTNILQKEQKDDLIVSEEKQEAAKVEKDQTDLLEEIADNTREKPGKDKDELGLGTIAAALTAALAGLAGAVAGYVKSIRVLLDVFTPDFIKTKLANTIANFEKTLVEFGGKLKNVFSKGVDKITTFFTEGLGKLKTIFTFDEASKIGKIITAFKEGFSKLFAPFTEAFTTIKNLISGTTKGLEFVGGVAKSISSTIGSIGKTLGSIASLFKGVFSVISKLATPLFIIMTLWDTVSNVIDRFESDGIVGAFVGVFEGLFKSIVAAPLDLLKDIVSWVLGKFGFDEAEKFLDSFSFVKLAEAYYDILIHPIDSIAKMIEGLSGIVDEYIVQPLADAFAPITDFFVGIKDSIVGFFEAIEIPKIGFTIPIIDKEVSIGPFYPFRREKPAEAEVSAGKEAPIAAQVVTPTKQQTVVTTAPETVTARGAGITQDMTVPAGTTVAQKALINGESAPSSRQEYYEQQGFTPEQISKLNAKQAKIDAIRSQDTNAKIEKDLAVMDSEAVALSKQAEVTKKVSPEEIKRETKAYTSQLNMTGMLVTPQPISGAAAAETSSAANMIYGASAENAAVAATPSQAPSTNNTVVAPTTVNNNTVNSYKPDVRNQDSSFRRMLDQRYVRV